MVAALSALNALSIDIMLPALPAIGHAFDLGHANDRQLVVTAYVAVFGVAQLVYGPLADAFGRRSVLLYALGIFVIGSVLCVVAPNFGLFLAARALQGVGAAATRTISAAVVRDLTQGRRMAQVMSLAMTLFMIVPIAAPGLGQLVLFIAPWRWIFATLLTYAVLVLVWIFMRLPETLREDHRIEFRPRVVAATYLGVLRERQTMGYTIATMFLTACLLGYITTAEQLFVEVYGLGAAFPLAFGSIAIAITCGTFINSRLVMRLGMRRISHTMMIAFTLCATLLAALAASDAAPFAVFTPLLALTFSVFGLVTGNFNALALEPIGRAAGSASALFGAVTTFGGAVLGGLIARAYDGTPTPFAIGLALSGAAAVITVTLTERGRLFEAGSRGRRPPAA
jgi:DHA1 family bicyclomycin/chloramphenicol resistance-like MFS transporter